MICAAVFGWSASDISKPRSKYLANASLKLKIFLIFNGIHGPTARALVFDVAAHHKEVALATPHGSTEFRPRNDESKSLRRVVGLARNAEFFRDHVLSQRAAVEQHRAPIETVEVGDAGAAHGSCTLKVRRSHCPNEGIPISSSAWAGIPAQDGRAV